MRRLLRLLPVVALASSPAAAFLDFQSEIPNGEASSCLTCHTRASGGAPWNNFGDLLFTTNGGTADNSGSLPGNGAFEDGFIWWNAAICNADSDGDGQTNGQELGDPECVWTSGDAARTTDLSNPGDPASTSADPDGVDGGGGGGEGEGEGEGDTGGCAAAEASVAVVGLLPALVLVGRRRRR